MYQSLSQRAMDIRNNCRAAWCDVCGDTTQPLYGAPPVCRGCMIAIPDITLDGKPAKITGRLNDFATVSELNGPVRVEFAWPTVRRIVARDGKFRSDRVHATPGAWKSMAQAV